MEILIAEDEKQIAETLRKSFLEEGHHAMVAYDGKETLRLINEIQFDVVLLDWVMPQISGIEVCRKIREANNPVPIILLTALTQISNKVQALNIGADDYITKPFSFIEVMARINAVLRRYSQTSDLLHFGDLILNVHDRVIETTRNVKIKITDKEFELIKYFITNKRIILSRESICRNVWGSDFIPSSNNVDVTVKNLRKKLEEATGKKYIKSIYGEGYVLIAE